MRRALSAISSFTLSLAMTVVSTRAHATVIARLSVDELAAQSDVVAIVAPTESHARWDGGHIFTDVTVRIERTVAGTPEASSVVIRLPGGIVGDTGQRVEGAPRLDPSARSIVFLRREQAGRYFVAGMSQGVLPIVTAPDGSVRVMPSRNDGLALVESPATASSSNAHVTVPNDGMAYATFARAVAAAIRR